MKKLMSLCLVACLILSLCQLALADVNDLSKAEFTSYTESLLKDALTVNRYQAEQTDGGYLLHFDRYTLKTDSDRLSANTKINGVIFDDLSDADDGMGDIRSVKLNDSMAVLLAAYPLENTALAGTREDAVLYIAGELPGQATVGYMKRDGQRALEITYSLYYMADGGVGVNTIQYTLKDGAVIRSELTLNKSLLTLKDAKDELSGYWEKREVNEYSAYLSAAESGSAEPFGRDDLIFSGLDLLDLTPETAVAVLGDDYAEEWLQDGNTYVHVMEWNAATVTFLHDSQKNLLRLDSFSMDEDTLEGPRGIRVGDQQQSVIERFQSGAGLSEGDVTYLYGTEKDESYGMAQYIGEGEVALRYVCVADDKQVTLLMNMEGAQLKEILFFME